MGNNLELVKLLYNELKSLDEGYFSYIIGTTATLIFVAGWFITSENAQKLVRQSKGFVFYVLFALLLIFVTYAWVDFHLLEKSREIGKRLQELSVNELASWNSVYLFRQMNPETIWLMLFARLLLFAGFILLLRYIRNKPAAPAEKPMD